MTKNGSIAVMRQMWAFDVDGRVLATAMLGRRTLSTAVLVCYKQVLIPSSDGRQKDEWDMMITMDDMRTRPWGEVATI